MPIALALGGIATTAVSATATSSLAKSFVDNTFKDLITPKRGSIVHCAMFGAEHTGIYVGNQEIVHLLGSGEIAKTSPGDFRDGTNAMTIYVACADKEPLVFEDAARRAEAKVGSSRNYNLLLDNCHQFTSGCITGNFNNPDNFFWMLEFTIEQSFADTFEWEPSILYK